MHHVINFPKTEQFDPPGSSYKTSMPYLTLVAEMVIGQVGHYI